MKFLAGFCAIAFIFALCQPSSAAQGTSEPTPAPSTNTEPVSTDDDTDQTDGGFSAEPTDDRATGEEGDVTVTRDATKVVPVPPLAPVVDAEVGNDAGLIGETDTAAPPVDSCAEYGQPEYNAEGDFYYSALCVKWRVCGGERVDDVVSGDIAGSEASGVYREYLGEMTGYIGAEATLPEGALDVNSVNDLLITQGLGDSPGDDLLPVFYWCTTRDANDILDPIDITTVRFSWDLTYGEVYDIPTVRSDLYTQLTAILNLYNPEPGAVPPIHGGYTFVQWPTWFFLENPLEQEHIFTTNNIDTFRIDLRATLLRVDWAFDDTTIASCTASEMRKYDPDNDDPIDDLPPCHYRFTQTDTQDLTITILYEIEEQVRSRPSATLDNYPNIGWTPYLNTPTTINLTTIVADYEIHEIVSVNVPTE